MPSLVQALHLPGLSKELLFALRSKECTHFLSTCVSTCLPKTSRMLGFRLGSYREERSRGFAWASRGICGVMAVYGRGMRGICGVEWPGQWPAYTGDERSRRVRMGICGGYMDECSRRRRAGFAWALCGICGIMGGVWAGNAWYLRGGRPTGDERSRRVRVGIVFAGYGRPMGGECVGRPTGDERTDLCA